jgi:hypothetical protein
MRLVIISKNLFISLQSHHVDLIQRKTDCRCNIETQVINMFTSMMTCTGKCYFSALPEVFNLVSVSTSKNFLPNKFINMISRWQFYFKYSQIVVLRSWHLHRDYVLFLITFIACVFSFSSGL